MIIISTNRSHLCLMCFRPPPSFTVLAAMASSCVSGNSQPDELVEQFFDHTDEP